MVVIEELAGASTVPIFPAAIVVLGAGSDDANGLFTPTGKIWHDAPVYENDRRCLLSREPHKNQRTGEISFGWILGQDKRPLYAVQSESLSLVSSGWRKFGGELPIPEIREVESVEEAAEAAATSLKEQGNTLFAARRYEEADAKWSRALTCISRFGEESPLQVALYSNRAESRLRLERWEDALADADEALQRKPTHAKALLRGAVAARELQRYGDARSFVQRCLISEPGLPEALQLLQDIEELVEQEQRLMPDRARAARQKLQQSVHQADGDPSSIPKAVDARDANSKKGFAAFSGYADKRVGKEEPPPISELPYHKMGLPQEQISLMDGFFKDLREQKKERDENLREDSNRYDKVKSEYTERAREELSRQGRGGPVELELKQRAPPAEDSTLVPELSGQPEAPLLASERPRLSQQEKDEIDVLFAGYTPKASSSTARPDRRTALEKELDEEEAAERQQAERSALEALHALQATRRGEPSRFEQAAGELYCWWKLPPGIAGRDVKVFASQGGSWLTVEVKGVVVFNRQLFHYTRADDLLWSVDADELQLTLTKGERSKLWDQLGCVSEIQRDLSGQVIEESIPEPMSGADRMDKFRQMVTGDDGTHASYEDLDASGRQMVDAMRRFEHARATGDQNALALAEIDLEEFGRLVI